MLTRIDLEHFENYWQCEPFEQRLRGLGRPIGSWDDLDLAIRRDLPELVFAADAMRMRGHGFNPGVAERLRKLLEMLATMKRHILPDGTYGKEWHELRDRWFKGGELFSDSSDTEKADFDSELTFKHPERPGAKLKCSWHGKVNTPKLRIHFSWPITRDEPLYVVYIGPKLTRRQAAPALTFSATRVRATSRRSGRCTRTGSRPHQGRAHDAAVASAPGG